MIKLSVKNWFRVFVPKKLLNFFFSSCLKAFSCDDCKKNIFLDAGWHTNFPRFQGARPDHVRVESTSCWSLRELVSFDHGTWHILLQSEKVFELEGITMFILLGMTVHWSGSQRDLGLQAALAPKKQGSRALGHHRHLKQGSRLQ